jgi:uncharacterized Zn finger protein
VSYFGWHPYVSVADRRRQAALKLLKLRRERKNVDPVTIEGRTIAKSFWGKSWCVNLDRYSDYASRLPRGRSYLRNGCVIDLQIKKGEIAAMVCGSSLYNVRIAIAPLARNRWKAICRDCSGSIDSLIELLQGRFAKNVMDRVCREGDGLFPHPKEIKLSCDCPDWADMCKHVAAVFYAVGARLDERPQLLFMLRGVAEAELLAGAGQDLSSIKRAPAGSKVLDQRDLEALFGLDMADSAGLDPQDASASAQPRFRSRTARERTARKSPAADRVASAHAGRIGVDAKKGRPRVPRGRVKLGKRS